MLGYTEHISLYSDEDNKQFVNCDCPIAEKTPYIIQHKMKPLPLPQKMAEALEMMLWYSPNNHSSVQSFNNEYLENQIFSDAIIQYYLRYAGIESKDIYFVSEKTIPYDYVKPYMTAVCNHCQKIIVTQNRNETKITSVFRHLRNSLAHGNFTLINDKTFVGFDKIKEQFTAVFKLSIENMYSFCKQLIEYPDFTVSHIFQYVLLKHGYTIISTGTGGKNYKDNSTYEELVFAIGPYNNLRINCSRYIKSSVKTSIELIQEYTLSYDDQFNEKVNYIDLFYCERNPEEIKMVYPNKYVINKQGLEHLFDADSTLLNGLKYQKLECV